MVRTRIVSVTPAQARKWLEGNTANRPIRRWWVLALAKEMKEGRWRLTHQGIAINCDGSLLDGQHRLLAIIEANMTVKMNVTTGLPRDASPAIDQGVMRSLRDIGGSPIGLDKHLTKAEIATGRAMKRGVDPTNFRISRVHVSNEEMLTYILKHREAIAWAIAHVMNHDLKLATILAVIARAYYTADRERLAAFCKTFCSGIAADPRDSAAVVLSRHIYCHRDEYRSVSGTNSLYLRTENMLRAFLNGEPAEKCCEAKAELFPLPDDKG